jgi:flagellar biosynthesis/type III secretory pathway chaperone
MNAPATIGHQSPLEAVLHEVQATLEQLLVAADEQHAALADNDRARLESVTQQQERLSARLARHEGRRIELLDGKPLREAIAALPETTRQRVELLRQDIASSVKQLQSRHARTALLLEQSVLLGNQTLKFLERLVSAPSPAYGKSGIAAPRSSVLVDSRA